MKKKLLVILALFSLVSCSNNGTVNVEYDDADKYSIGDHTYNEEITELDVGFVDGNINITSGLTLSVSEKGEHEDFLKIHHLLENNTLTVRDTGAGKIPSEDYKKEVTVTVPNSLDKIKFNNVYIDAVSTVDTKELEIECVSGNYNLTSSILENVEINSTSAYIDLYILEGKTLNIDRDDSLSGTVTGDYEVGNDIYIKMEGISNTLNIHRISK